MTVTLRPYQQEMEQRAFALWHAGTRNVCMVMPTGAGKTATLSSIILKHPGYSIAIAHRKELVSQLAVALARNGVRHRVIGTPSLVKFIIQEQMRELGTSFYDPNARCAVASVDTIVARAKDLAHWLLQVSLWVCDESAHLIRGNKWGKAIDMMPNAIGLGPTATPTRADGKGLGRDAAGFMDTIIVGPSMRWLIEQGYLTDYRVFCPPSDLHLEQVPITESGDYSPKPLKKAVRESHIVGDVVDHYLRIAPGKLGVVFNSDVETAGDVSAKFNVAGVKCEVVTGNTPDAIRSEVIRRFRKAALTILSSVDIFGEGFDLPAIHVAMFARPTQSYSLFVQQFGRALRPVYAPGHDLSTQAGRLASIAASDKPYAIIIDHVGNVLRHGLPDAPREWTLASRDKRSKAKATDEIPLRPCPQCTRPYERVLVVCPYCQFKPEPSGRSAPEFVDGDLFELDAATLARMRSDVDRVDADFESVAQAMQRAGAPDIAIHGARKQHRMRGEMQEALRASISWWAGYHKAQGRSDAESMRRFYHTFGTDILTAQSLGRPEALALADRINLTLVGMT